MDTPLCKLGRYRLQIWGEPLRTLELRMFAYDWCGTDRTGSCKIAPCSYSVWLGPVGPNQQKNAHVTPTLSCSLRLARGQWPEPPQKDRHIAVTLAVPHYTPSPSL